MSYMTEEEFRQLKPGDILQLRGDQQPCWLNNAIVEVVKNKISIDKDTTIRVVYLNVDPPKTDWDLVVSESVLKFQPNGFRQRHLGKLWSSLSRDALKPKCKRLQRKWINED